jgi:putative Mg2+ transporter-C (MgtC) family protein
MLSSISWTQLAWDALYLAIAYLLAFPIGWDREKEERTAGIRTFPIVCVASCGLALLATRLPGAAAESSSRVIQGLITGIGFIGGGAILQQKGGVSGTATAASVWNIGIVGAAVGFGLVHIAIVLSLINLLTLRLLRPFKQESRQPDQNT